MKLNRRVELIVNLKAPRQVRTLKRYGSLKYFSKSMRYAILYVRLANCRHVENRIRHLRFVSNVQKSPLADLAEQLVAKTVAASQVEDRDDNG